jgi:hypothetical protein
MGGVMSDSTAKEWPALSREVANAEINMPAESQATNRVMEMGPLFKYFHPDVYGVAGPLNTIALNRQLIEKDNQDVGDVITHELTHVGQGSSKYFRKTQDLENEAVNKEAMRPIRRNDIYLRPEVDTSPSKKIRR